MWFLLLGLTSGLLASSCASIVNEVKARSCSYAGVFQIQGNDRYTLTFENAKELCEKLGTTLANLDQVTAAHGKGMESCRYGWISNGNITIPRHVPTSQCANNQTGVISLVPTENEFDAFCYDETDQFEKNCTFEIKYPETDPEKVTEDNVSQDLETTDLPTDLSTTEDPLDLSANNTVTDITEASHTEVGTNHTPYSSHDALKELEEAPDQTTRFPFMTTEPKDITTAITSLDSAGSGMEEATLSTTSERTNEEIDTLEDYMTAVAKTETPVTTTDDEPQKPGQSVHPGGRKAPDMAATPEDKASSGSSKDWLVILLVVVAIVAIILVCALVITRNRLCGRSQTLMITSKSSSEGNGTAASAASPQAQEREQEMVTLMNKEKIQENGNTEEFTVITLEESPEKNEQA